MMRSVAASIACVLVLTGIALAHDHWINHGNFVSPVDGTHCCGENDCFKIASDDVRVTGRGYFLVRLNETVPFRETLTSQDGNYWRCRRPDGSRRCFFAPPPNV
ncbi:MAG: hypothetical protein IRZ09_12565 [Variibacter sp.]|nr:hypothetical protein [Variibacter sp.]